MAGQNKLKFTITAEIPADATQQLVKAAEEGFHAVAGELNVRFKEALSANVWTWPRQSKRGISGGTLSEVARNWSNANYNTPQQRNIWDSGNLSRSGMYDVSGLKAEYIWTADYAAWVHDGATIHPFGNKNKQVRLPGRPWTTAVLEGHNLYSGEVYDLPTELQKRITDITI